MKKALLILIAIIGAIIIILIVLRLTSPEDTWIIDSRGVWVKHGNPSSTPEEVKQQQYLINQANLLYKNAQKSGKDLTAGPCLGNADADTVVDIAHSPRQVIDNFSENQCALGTAHHFIELDINGNIIKIE